MNSIYSDFYNLLISAYSFPYSQCKLLEESISTFDKPEQSDESEIILQAYKLYLQKTNELIVTKGDQYFIDIIALNKTLEKANEFSNSFENILSKSQIRERFYPQPNDSLPVRLGKFPKRLLQQIIWLAPRTKNFYNHLLKKDKKALQYKNHKVKKEQLAKLVYINFFLEAIDKLYEETLFNRQAILLQLKELNYFLGKDILVDSKIEKEKYLTKVKEIENLIAHYKKGIQSEIENIENRLNEQFEDLQLKYGTFEFPSRKTKLNKLISKQEKYFSLYRKISESYSVSYIALAKHWQFKIEGNSVFTFSTIHFNSTILTLSENVTNNIEKTFSPLLEELKKWIQQNKDLTDIATSIFKNKFLSLYIPNITNAILQTDLEKPIEEIESLLWEQINAIQTEIQIPFKGNYTQALPKKNLKKLDTSIIIQTIFQENITERLTEEKSILIKRIQKFLQNLNEITQILEFTLEHYATASEEKKSDYSMDFKGSINRILTKTEETFKLIQQTKEEIILNFSAINSNFIKSLNQALEPDEILHIIGKYERKNRIKNIQNLIFLFFRKTYIFLRKSMIVIKKAYVHIKNKYLNIRILFGINTSAKTISNELTNYLSETANTIESLPSMYQKLFNSEPLIKDRLYIERKEVTKQLNETYENWLHNKFAPTCLIGEFGSGATTTFNFFEKKISDKIPTYRLILEQQITSANDFTELIKQIFNDQQFETLEDLKAQLDVLNSKRIVILENIHNLYIRSNNGFANLNKFLKLISETNTSVFWLCSSNLYAWKYLNYAQQISDYFGYIIEIESLKKEQIIKTIEDRHLPSGYNITFLEKDNFKASRKYKKYDEVRKQEFLREDFFNRLNKITQGNISLSLLFWQTSVVKKENDTFSLKLKEFDLSFIESLGMQKLTTLHNLLIHGGLSQENHNKIFGIPVSQSSNQLMVLKNDAIIVMNNGKYQINPLLYRQIVNHLKGINLIH